MIKYDKINIYIAIDDYCQKLKLVSTQLPHLLADRQCSTCHKRCVHVSGAGGRSSPGTPERYIAGQTLVQTL